MSGLEHLPASGVDLAEIDRSGHWPVPTPVAERLVGTVAAITIAAWLGYGSFESTTFPKLVKPST